MADGKQTYIGAVASLDRSIPFGTVIYIPGRGNFVVEDRVGWGSDFDIYDPSCSSADNWGRRHLAVSIS